MKKTQRIVILFLLLGGLLSCDKIKEEDVIEPKTQEEKLLVKQIDQIDSEISDIFMKFNYHLELYVQYEDDDKLVRVENFDDLEKERIAYSYNIVRYPETKQLKYVSEIPNNHGENWENIYNSLYDENGNLIKFTRISRFDVYVEMSNYYYDSSQKLIKKTYDLSNLLMLGQSQESITIEDYFARHSYKQRKKATDWKFE